MLLKAIGVVIASFLIFRIGEIIFQLGLTKTVINHLPGPCQLVDGVEYGSEDMEMTSDGLVFISSGFSSRVALGDHPNFSKGKGQIFLFNMNKPEVKVTPLKITMSPQSSLDISIMTPHGLSLYEEKAKDVVTLFLVNHPTGENDRVEKFHYRRSDRTLTHVKSYMDDSKIGILNDVVATSEDTFYTTMYYYNSPGWKLTLESKLMLKWGGLLYYDGEKFQIVFPSGSFFVPNGLGISKDKRLLYMVTDIHYLKIFKIRDDSSLELATSHSIPFGLDNIFVDHDSNALWMAGHPILWKVLLHLHDPVNKTPSQVIRVQLDDANVTDTVDILKDDGDLLSGSTSAVHRKGRLLVGTAQTKLLYCDIKAPIRSLRP